MEAAMKIRLEHFRKEAEIGFSDWNGTDKKLEQNKEAEHVADRTG